MKGGETAKRKSRSSASAISVVNPAETIPTQSKPKMSNKSVSPPILSEKYIDGYTSKNDLVRRLQNVLEALSDENVAPDSDQYPGLDGLASRLVDETYLHHKDKEVRLYTCLACMEIFALYAPEPPYDPEEVFEIFEQLIAQLGNLVHTTSESQPNYHNYFSLLEHLSEVRTGIVLVEYCRGYSGSPSSASPSEDDELAERALELLTDLIRIILDSVQNEHSSEVRQHAASAISACIGEFQHTIPICILDVILSCISKGPKVWVHPAVRQQVNGDIAEGKGVSKKRSTRSKPEAPHGPVALEKTDNISYRIAAKVIETTKDKCSTPIASLLNGILNGESFALSHSSISADDPEEGSASKATSRQRAQDDTSQESPNVWSIVYELHRIAPEILTTVIGTIASSMRVEDRTMRHRVVKLLGKLFYSPVPKSMMAMRFFSCYKEWCHRYKDSDVEIRATVLSCLVKTLETYADKDGATELRGFSTSCLEAIINSDPDAGIRDEAIQRVCELCLATPEIIPPSLLRVVGDRVKGKNSSKAERKDALTGLAQLYHIHYLQKKLRVVENIEESNVKDLDIDVKCISDVLSSLDESSSRPGKGKRKPTEKGLVRGEEYYRSPAQVEEQFYWIPEIVMESAWYTDQMDSDMRNRVIQIIDDILLGPPNEVEGTESRVQQMSATSRALGFTLMVNSLVRDSDDAERNVEETNAYKWLSSLLVQRASLQAAVSAYIDARADIKNHAADSVEAMKANGAAFAALEKVSTLTPTPQNEKDKILQSIHAARDRHLFRVLSTIATPNHSKNARARAFQDLPLRARQCSLGKSEIAWLKTCARRCAMGAIDAELTEQLILLIKLCVQEALAASIAQEAKSSLHNAVCLMRALKLLSQAFPSMVSGCGSDDRDKSVGFSHVQETFLLLRSQKCSRPVHKEFESASVLSRILDILALATPYVCGPLIPEIEDELIKICTHDQSADLVRPAIQILSSGSSTAEERFHELLKNFSNGHALSIANKRLTAVLTGLSMLAAWFPNQWREAAKSGATEKVVDFAFHKILLFEGHNDVEPDSDESPSKGSSASRSGSSSTEAFAGVICASIEFLCAHVRALHESKEFQSSFKDEREFIQCVMNVVQNGGNHDAWSSSTTVFRSTPFTRSQIRLTATLALFRMIGDVALQLEDKYPSIELWQAIANTLLDEDSVVRSVVVKEWMNAVSGVEQYCHGKKFAPSLRFLAMGIYCVDGETSYPVANGSAGSIHNLSMAAKETTLQCVLALRRTCQLVEAQCAALGPEGESNYERRLKMKIMPEFAVPFVFHLLSHRPETPTSRPSDDAEEELVDGKRARSNEEDGGNIGEDVDFSSKELVKARYRQLRKRLKWLLEPLVHSLGEGGDNISFLLRMSELLGKNFRPIVTSTAYKHSDASKRLSVVCRAARDVLLRLVKKDADLTPYPGPIQVPAALFTKNSVVRDSTPSKLLKQRNGRVSFADEADFEGSSDEDDSPQIHADEEEVQKPIAGGSSDTNGEKSSSSRSGSHASAIHLDTPPDDDWGMSPIAPSASPHHNQFETVASSEKSSRTHPSPPFLSPILRGSNKERTSSSKKLNVSFSSIGDPSSGGKEAAAQVATTAFSTPMSDISDELGAGAKKRKESSKKLVVMKMTSASLAPDLAIQSKRSASRSSSSTSGSRSSSRLSKSPVVHDNNLDFEDDDEFDSGVTAKRQKSSTSLGGKKRKPQSASSTGTPATKSVPSPSDRARAEKKDNAPGRRTAAAANNPRTARKGKASAEPKS